MDSEPRDDDERIVRYIAGQCSPFEAARMQRWIAANPARWERFQALERVWRACGKEPSGRARAEGRWKVDAALALLRGSLEPAAEVRAEERAPPLVPSGVPKRAPRRPSVAPLTLRKPTNRRWHAGAMSIAAGSVLAVAGLIGWQAIAGRSPGREGATRAAVAPLQEVATARGQRATITLSDGTRMILGAASNVRYARDFGARGARDVYLDGQAYFEVVHDTLHPFAVHTSRGVAEDLGTEFVVTAYSTLSDMQVVVASGQVALRHAASSEADSGVGRGRAAAPLTLGAGELGVIDSSGSVRRSRVADASPYFDWTKGELVFNGAPLKEALPAIGRWYDVEIKIGDPSLAGRRLVARFGPHSAREVVRLLALAANARSEQHGDTIVLLPR